MKRCKKCLEPDTRPDCIFDEEQLCYPCKYQNKIDEINWQARRQELEEVAKWAKQNNTSGYDCMIGVSGGKDSHRQALFARDELGLKPLLVSCTYPPQQQTDRGAANLANLARLGFEVIAVRPAPETWRILVRWGITKFANWCKSTEMALYACVPKMAITYNIKLIILGENPALSWGSSGGSLDGDASKMKYNNTLQGGDIKPLLESGVTKKEVYWYLFPSDEDMQRVGLRQIYLGYYIKDFNDYTNSQIAIKHGLSVRTGRDAIPEDIGQITNYDALDDDFVHLNQMLKFFKFGFGKASEQASGFIKNKMMTREEAIAKVKDIDGKCAKRYIERFCDYIQISKEEFWEIADSCRSKDLWEKDKDGKWHFKYPLE